MKTKLDANRRIFNAALKEFSTYGFSGARMDRIAKEAKINKAMIFYYFSSKEKLYELVIRDVFSGIYPKMLELLSSDPSAGEFLERATEIYVGIFSRSPEFVKMIALELIQNPDNLRSYIRGMFDSNEHAPASTGPVRIRELVEKWFAEGSITEGDPFQFMLNLSSLSLLSFLGKPFLEAVFQLSVPPEEFEKKRIESVVNLLKRGMLT
jgi:TetR/AcrR family transcriptional regulator